jgi:hypothetical protein
MRGHTSGLRHHTARIYHTLPIPAARVFLILIDSLYHSEQLQFSEIQPNARQIQPRQSVLMVENRDGTEDSCRRYRPFSVSLTSALSLLMLIRYSDLEVNIRSA